MSPTVMRNFLFSLLLLWVGGCSFGPWGGLAYTIDPSKIGTGEQAIVPRNDGVYVDGMPMDMRRRR